MGGVHRFYITRPNMIFVTQIAEHIKDDLRSGEQREYRIIFVPRKLATADYILEREGVFQYVTILEWDQLHLIPLDEHLLSLERSNAIPTLYLDGDHTMLYSIAKSVLLLEDVFGTIPLVHGKGHLAEKVWRIIGRLVESRPITPPQQPSGISELILFDRQCDLVTPLCSQLTYEGILDDVFSIRSGFAEFGKDVTGKEQNVKVLVNAQDPVFAEIRSLHFAAVPGVLSDITKRLRVDYNEGKATSSVSGLKSFVERLPELRKKHDSLSTHLKVSEKIVQRKVAGEFQKQLEYERAILEAAEKTQITDYIEECLHRQINIRIPLRLMCLMSTTNNGIKPKYLDCLKTQFLHSYGHQHLATFYNLEQFGMIQEKVEEASQIPGQAHKSTFKQLAKQLKLVPKHPDSYDVHAPKDMAYVYGGAYQPLSCAAIDYIARSGGWKGLDDVVKSWSGPIFTCGQGVSIRDRAYSSRSAPMPAAPPRVILVYFIGGCTFSEINALRFLKEKTNRHYIVATTHLINPDSVIDSLLPEKL